MKESIIRGGCFLFMLLLAGYVHADAAIEKRLEQNAERLSLENYYYHGIHSEIGAAYSIAFIHYNGSFYSLTDYCFNIEAIGHQRYFAGGEEISGRIQEASTEIADRQLLLDDFIREYLSKDEGESFYTVPETKKLFHPNKAGQILFAAVYNYDFLILIRSVGTSGRVELYLPEDYPGKKKFESKGNDRGIIIAVLFTSIFILAIGFLIKLRKKRTEGRCSWG